MQPEMDPESQHAHLYGADLSALSNEGKRPPGQLIGWAPVQSIGPYRLLERIGAGGMGEVWLAEQTQPVQRRVAIKLIKAGMDTSEVVARFQAERQALAMMDHSSIAKVFHAGSTVEGRPYFAMEHIKGTHITDYCDHRKMNLRQRLELFTQVCDGVQHAHQKAVIHRDLKPSNILVEGDLTPHPRIIDFGIAKAFSDGRIEATQFTRPGAIVGTPEYMSPEQADATTAGVDTRSDIYSLGAVLYELLVGVRPLELHDLPLTEQLRRLREEEPQRPSAKAGAMGELATEAAANRGCDLPALTRQLRGDLDAIVLKALEKHPSHRYSAATELAADIGRYLNGQTVQAVPPSAVYRARKFVHRNRGTVAGASAFALLLIVATALSVSEAARAIRERNRADTEAATARVVTTFLQNDLLAQADPTAQWVSAGSPDPDLKVRTALDRAGARIEGRFGRQPEIEAAIRETIGETYVALGLAAEARKQLQRAFDLRVQSLGINDANTLRTTSHLASSALIQGDLATSEKLLTEAVAAQSRRLGPEDPDTLFSRSSLASTYREQGRYPEAEKMVDGLLEVSRRIYGPDGLPTLDCMDKLAQIYYREGNYSKAEEMGKRVLPLRVKAQGAENPFTTITMSDLANAYAAQGKFPLAEPIYVQVTETRRRVEGPQSAWTLAAMNNLGQIYTETGKYAMAEALDRQTMETRRRLLGLSHVETLMSMDNLACDYANLHKHAEAEALFAKTAELQTHLLGRESRFTLGTLADTAFLYQRERKYALAEKYAAEVLADWRKALGPHSAVTMDAAADLALADISLGKFVEAEPLAREAVEFSRANRPEDWRRFRAESLLGTSLAGQKRYAEAKTLLVEGYQGMQARKELMAAPDRYHLRLAGEWVHQFSRN